jgi:hypothetical protein
LHIFFHFHCLFFKIRVFSACVMAINDEFQANNNQNSIVFL